MSTKMYNYRLPKEQWWPFARACRAFYLAEHPISKLLAQSALEPGANYGSLRRLVNTLVDSGWTVDLQLFDDGDTWLIRPLEHGYFFLNNASGWSWQFGLERVYYDNRADVPAEDEKNASVAEWVDKKILLGEYLTYTVLDHDTFMSICVDQMLAQRV